MLERLSPYAAINYIRKAIGYDEFCTEYADYRRIKADDLFDVLDELLDAAREYKTYDAWFDHIENYTKELQEFYRVQNQNPNSVALATLHSAKGLEYENVYIIDVNEGVMPYKKAVLEPEVEEERRMFYVGMTRAKKNLHLFSVRQLNHKDAEISRFIKEASHRKRRRINHPSPRRLPRLKVRQNGRIQPRILHRPQCYQGKDCLRCLQNNDK